MSYLFIPLFSKYRDSNSTQNSHIDKRAVQWIGCCRSDDGRMAPFEISWNGDRRGAAEVGETQQINKDVSQKWRDIWGHFHINRWSPTINAKFDDLMR